MNYQLLITNPWTIALLSSLTTAVVIPFLSVIIKKVRSCFGVFSGQYIGLTGNLNSNHILLEDVRCKQIGNKLIGKIYGVAIIEKLDKELKYREKMKNVGKYKFRGFVDERIFVISYRTVIPAQHSSGAIALDGNSMGTLHRGIWTGLVEDSIEQSACRWIKLPRKISSKRNQAAFISEALEYLNSNRKDSTRIYTIGKSGRLDAIVKSLGDAKPIKFD